MLRSLCIFVAVAVAFEVILQVCFAEGKGRGKRRRCPNACVRKFDDYQKVKVCSISIVYFVTLIAILPPSPTRLANVGFFSPLSLSLIISLAERNMRNVVLFIESAFSQALLNYFISRCHTRRQICLGDKKNETSSQAKGYMRLQPSLHHPICASLEFLYQSLPECIVRN